MKTIIAIDPGSKGSIGWLKPDGNVETFRMSDDASIRQCITNLGKMPSPVCYMEKVGGFIGNQDGKGVGTGPAMFNFGNGFGFIRGLLAACEIPLVMVQPRAWQAGIPNACGNKTARKNAYKDQAARLYPKIKVVLDLADMLCILDYARYKEFNLSPTKPSKKPNLPAPVATLNAETTQKIVQMLEIPRSVKGQIPLAIAWCKAKGYKVPDRGTPQFSAMLDYWYNKAINNEL